MDSDSLVPAIASRQAGAFTRRQALDQGATPAQVKWRIRRGLWVPVAGRAFRAAARPPDELTFLHAAALTWPDGVVALGQAARVHRLPVPDDRTVDVLVPTGRRGCGSLVPHRYAIDPDDVVTVDGIHVTSRRRTILDCLGRLRQPDAMRLLAWVSSHRLVASDDLTSWLAEHPQRWGNAARRLAARRLATGAVGPAEERLHAILHRARITGWIAGASLVEQLGVWAQADVYFPEVRLVIEVDGRAAHQDRFQSDRTRQNLLTAAGCTVLRYTWADLRDRPTEVVSQIRAILAMLRRSSATSRP